MSKMMEMMKEELRTNGAFDCPMPAVLEMTVNSIQFQTVPERMKYTIAVNEVMTFASQFRRNILLKEGTLVPINTIGFVITGSGENKDSSVKAARKCFKPGYTMIEEHRKKLNVAAAKKAAQNAGEDMPDEFSVYKAYMKALPPIFMAPTTGPGFVQHVNDLGDHPIGAGLLYSGEFGDELAYNQDMVENIKILSEVYDTGDKEAKYTKGVEHRAKAIESQPVSALFVGSPAYILYDGPTKKKFEIAFMSKLARRSWFCYTPQTIPEPEYGSAIEMIEAQDAIEAKAQEARDVMKDGIKSLTEYQLQQLAKPIGVTKEVEDLFKIYKRYNYEKSLLMFNPNSTAVLVRKHLQWKALKLAGAFAVFAMADNIEKEHYIKAIRFCEMLSEDMQLFEAELNKQVHERFADYIRSIVTADGLATMTVHDLKKKGYINTINHQKLHELITGAAAYDPTGIYTIMDKDSGVHYESIITTEDITLSYKKIDNTAIFDAIKTGDKLKITAAKNKVGSTANTGFEVGTTTFEELGEMLKGDYAYSPFIFENNTRGRDNIISGAKFVVFDIDSSHINAEEAHFMLSDINHHIALSSDANNDFKFRVIVELDAIVELEPLVWKYFYEAIAHELALSIDALPQSQVFFSYSGREVLSVTDADTIKARDFIMQAIEKSETKTQVKAMTTAHKQALIDDELTTFAQAFNAENGEGSRKMIWAAKYAHYDLGMDIEETIELIRRINDYWIHPMDDDRLERTILSQVRRF